MSESYEWRCRVTVTKNYQIAKFKDWNHEIFAAIKDFKLAHKIAPQILIVSQATGRRLDALLSAELYEKGHENYLQSLGEFACAEARLIVCLEEGLSYGEYTLVYDDEAEFEEEDRGAADNAVKEGRFLYVA
jgi:hypothetical protein